MSPHEAADAVLDVLQGGGLAVVPFDVSYAFLGATRDALERIYALKLRPGSKPCPMLASWDHFVDVSAAGAKQVAAMKRIDAAGLPVGMITAPNADSAVVRSIPSDCTDMLVKDGRLALFINMGGLSDLLIEVADAAGVRLFGSSANLSGTGNSFRLDEVPESMLANVDITCEAETCRYANPERMASSIIDVEGVSFVRRGILADEIERVMLDGESVADEG